MAKKQKAGKARRPASLDEALARLEQIKHDSSLINARIHADDARDSFLEFSREVYVKLRRRASRKRKLKKQSIEFRTRLVELLHALATGPVVLPTPPGRPVLDHDALLHAYRQLREQDFPAVAQALQEVAGKGRESDYLRLLSSAALLDGSRMLVESRVRHAGRRWTGPDEDAFLVRLRYHLAGKLCTLLARRVGYQVTPEMGQRLEGLLGGGLRFLADLLAATPPGRLLVPQEDSPFDPDRHEAVNGQPRGDQKVKGILFPGYLVHDTPPRVLAKAEVFIERAGPPAS
jgi:hypothetical protein